MKNACNPVFSNPADYKVFRAKFAIWIPTLKTLDGTDFKDDQPLITKLKPLEQSKKTKSSGLASIPEETKDGKSGVDKSIKAQSGTTAF